MMHRCLVDQHAISVVGQEVCAAAAPQPKAPVFGRIAAEAHGKAVSLVLTDQVGSFDLDQLRRPHEALCGTKEMIKPV